LILINKKQIDRDALGIHNQCRSLGTWHCAAVFFSQVPKKSTDLNLSLLYILILGIYSKFARENNFLALGVCFPQLCSCAGRRFAASRTRLQNYRRIVSFPQQKIQTMNNRVGAGRGKNNDKNCDIHFNLNCPRIFVVVRFRPLCLSSFLPWMFNNQPNRWTKRMTITRLATQDPRNCSGPEDRG